MKVIAITPLIAGIASATPFFFQPTVDPTLLRRHVTRAGLLKHVYKLQEFADADEKGNRGFGGTGHKKTVDYIVKWFKQWPQYYKVETQDFVHEYSAGSSEIKVEGEVVDSKFFTYSPSGQFTEALVPVANLGCTAEDFPAETSGKIALISRGTCEFGLKVALAGAAGAKGAIIYNNAAGELSGTLGAPSRPQGPYVPVAGITQEKGQSLLTDIQAGAVLATLNIDAVLENRTTTNVFATTRGGDQNNIVQLGGHTDSIVGAGINDDGSGVMAQLEVAKHLTNYKVNNAVRFSFWTAEEFGLVGSEYYIANLPKAEQDKIRLYLNFDMIGSPNYIFGIYDGDGSGFNLTGPAGSDQIEYLYEKYYKSVGEKSVPTEFSGRSDYGPFLDVGIPSGGLFTGAEGVKTAEEVKLFGGKLGEWYDPNYHQKGDSFKNLDWKAFYINTGAVAHSVATYAKSLKGFPKRNTTATVTKRQSVEDELHALEHGHAKETHSCGGKALLM